MVALAARSILKTGDTRIDLDPNIVAYRNGLLVRDGHDRSTPPLAAYVTAGSFALFGESSFTARLPFAVMGLGTIALMLVWLRSSPLPLASQTLFAIAILGNVSFFLFNRQCRYYAPTLLLSVAVVYFYLNENKRPACLVALSVLAALLFSANYLAYAALVVCLGVDYLLWRHRERRFSFKEIALLLIPQAIIILAIVRVWNPLETGFGEYAGTNSLIDRLKLFSWNFRDINTCEFVVGGLMLAAPVAGVYFKNSWLIRASLALIVYIAFVTVISPQLVQQTSVADVRYLIGVIPLGFFLGAETLRVLGQSQPRLLIPLALLIFGTNVLNGGPFSPRGFQSTFASFLGELARPPDDPFRPTAQWMSAHLKPGESVLVAPGYMAYPLMVLEPNAVYAWQLQDPPRPEFRNLPDIHFAGRIAPDYLIAFGPNVGPLIQMIRSSRLPVRYEHIATLEHFWKDLYRPELFWRTFAPISHFDPKQDAIYIFKKQSPEPAP